MHGPRPGPALAFAFKGVVLLLSFVASMALVFEVQLFASAKARRCAFASVYENRTFQSGPESVSRFAFRSKCSEQLDRFPGVKAQRVRRSLNRGVTFD